MEIEAKAFYLLKCSPDKKKIKGTMHIYLPEKGIHIRGCLIHLDGSSFFAALPHFKAPDDQNKLVRFPTLVFDDKNFNDELKAEFVIFAKKYLTLITDSLTPKAHQVASKTFKKPFKKPYNKGSGGKPYKKPYDNRKPPYKPNAVATEKKKVDWDAVAKIQMKKFADIKK